MTPPIEHTVALASAGSYGPTIVHIQQASVPIHVTMRTGTVMSLLQTATGRAFAAYLPSMTVDALVAIERAGALQIGSELPRLLARASRVRSMNRSPASMHTERAHVRSFARHRTCDHRHQAEWFVRYGMERQHCRCTTRVRAQLYRTRSDLSDHKA